MVSLVGSQGQPRERPVPCNPCGYKMRGGNAMPNTMTWNLSAFCDKHEAEHQKKNFETIERLRNDFQ